MALQPGERGDHFSIATFSVEAKQLGALVADPRVGEAPTNRAAALHSARPAVTFLVRAAERLGTSNENLRELAELFTSDIISDAIDEQVARSRVAHDLQDPEKSQSLHSRINSLRTIARHGLQRPELASLISIIAKARSKYVVGPGQSDDRAVEAMCRQIKHNPHMAARLVNAPGHLAAEAEQLLKVAEINQQKLAALRLFATAAVFAIQLARPVRTENLQRLRHRSSEAAGAQIRWLQDGKRAEIIYPPGEVKNNRTIDEEIVEDENEVAEPVIDRYGPDGPEYGTHTRVEHSERGRSLIAARSALIAATDAVFQVHDQLRAEMSVEALRERIATESRQS